MERKYLPPPDGVTAKSREGYLFNWWIYSSCLWFVYLYYQPGVRVSLRAPSTASANYGAWSLRPGKCPMAQVVETFGFREIATSCGEAFGCCLLPLGQILLGLLFRTLWLRAQESHLSLSLLFFFGSNYACAKMSGGTSAGFTCLVQSN